MNIIAPIPSTLCWSVLCLDLINESSLITLTGNKQQFGDISEKPTCYEYNDSSTVVSWISFKDFIELEQSSQ